MTDDGLPRIFVSYRRHLAALVGPLSDLLRDDLGAPRIFRDVDDLQPGENWREGLAIALADSTTVLVLIDEGWRQGTDTTLEDASDVVRWELEEALGDERHTVIPILLDGVLAPAAPPEVVTRLMGKHGLSVAVGESIADPDGLPYQRLLVAVWHGIVRSAPGRRVLLLSGHRRLGHVDVDALTAHVTALKRDVRELTRYAAGAVLLDVGSARVTARRWPDVIMLDEDLTTPLGRLRQQAVEEHPRLSLGVLSGGALLTGVGASQVAPEAVGWGRRAVDLAQARPRGTALALLGGAGGAAGVVVLATPDVGVSFEHAGFQVEVTDAHVQEAPLLVEADEEDPDPDLDHAVLTFTAVDPGLDTNGVRFAGVGPETAYALILDDGSSHPAVEADGDWGNLDGDYVVDFAVPTGSSLRGAALRTQLLEGYEPTVVGLTDGLVRPVTAPVAVPDPTFEGPFGNGTARITITDAWASREAGADEHGQMLTGLDFGLRTRALEGSVLVHLQLEMAAESPHGTILGGLVVLVDGERHLVDGDDPEQVEELTSDGAVQTYAAVVEVPVDAPTIEVGFREHLTQAWYDEIEATIALDASFLEDFQQR